MLFLTSQVYGQLISFDAKYKISCVKHYESWSSWAEPMKVETSIIINGEQIVITNKNRSYEFFYLHGKVGRDTGINTEDNDTYESITHLATDMKGDSLYVTIYNYDSGEHALAIILSKAEYVYFTKKPPKE